MFASVVQRSTTLGKASGTLSPERNSPSTVNQASRSAMSHLGAKQR